MGKKKGDEEEEEVGRFTGRIVWREERFDTVIVPAESIRNKADAKINGSFKDFVKWMNCLGYEFEITGNNLTFRDRNYFYNKEITTLTLAEDEVADLVTTVNADQCYTALRIGYENQDYDGKANGAYESFGTYEYTTGFEYSEEVELDLVSPYRADPIGIELLLTERDKDSSKDKNDKDIFFVAVNKIPGSTNMAAENGDRIVTESGDGIISETSEVSLEPYIEYTDYVIYTGLVPDLSPWGMSEFNAVFHPRLLIIYNESLIGINCKAVVDAPNNPKLRFVGTEACRRAQMPGYGKEFLYQSMYINYQLHDPIEYNFATGYLPDLPSDKRGLVRFTYKGKQMQGFIKQIAKNYSKEQSVEWTLYKVREA